MDLGDDVLQTVPICAGYVLVKTTPQKTRFRDVKYARNWDTD